MCVEPGPCQSRPTRKVHSESSRRELLLTFSNALSNSKGDIRRLTLPIWWHLRDRERYLTEMMDTVEYICNLNDKWGLGESWLRMGRTGSRGRSDL